MSPSASTSVEEGVRLRAEEAVSRKSQHTGVSNETSGSFFTSAVGSVGDAELCRQHCPPYVLLSLSSRGSLPKMSDRSGWEMKCRHCSKGEAEKVHLKKGEEDLASSCIDSDVAPVISSVLPALQLSITSCKRNQVGLRTQIRNVGTRDMGKLSRCCC